MKPWLLALIASGWERVTLPPFTSNTTWTAPAGVTSLVSAVGQGGPGEPEYSVEGYTWDTLTYTYWRDSPQTVSRQIGPFSEGPLPSPYCDDRVETPNDPFREGYMVCYAGEPTTKDYPASRGASATAFGKTFLGGLGGPASPVTFENVPVTPGQVYQIKVPPGGSITITFYK